MLTALATAAFMPNMIILLNLVLKGFKNVIRGTRKNLARKKMK
jgi:hypothetical protein